jgi:anion-transporting  ArsA/GET3 family ATPase
MFRGAEVGHEAAVELAPGLFGVQIDVEHAIEEYLTGQFKVRPLVELLTRSKAFHTFAAAAPGLPELVTVGKVWTYAVALHEDRRPVWDTLVVDCPATGHGIAMLETASNVEAIAGGGPIRDQAARIQEVIAHPAATGIAIVARPEELAVSEAVEAAGLLRGRGLPVAAAILNGVRDARFAAVEEPALAAVAAAQDGPVSRAAAAGLRRLADQRSDAAYRRRLAEGTRLPVLELPELVRRRFGLDALGALADALGDEFSRNGRP